MIVIRINHCRSKWRHSCVTPQSLKLYQSIARSIPVITNITY